MIIPLLFILSCNIESSYPKAEWTLMFYLGDDYSTIGLTYDISELISKEVNTTNIRLIILYDGPEDGDSKLEILDSPFSNNSKIINLQSTPIPTNDSGELNMADSKTLEAYITYVKENAPAARYALYFGSHGTGFSSTFLSGLAVENETYMDSSLLTISEIVETIKMTTPIDLVVFDACNIGNIETIYEFKDASKYIIASPEEIPGPGNDYIGFIEAAYNLSDFSALALGKATLQAYFNSYNFPQNSYQQLYDVKMISTLVEGTLFKKELIDFYDTRTNYRSFNGGNYTELHDLILDNTELDNGITIADGGEHRWLSIYMPTKTDYNSSYETTAFATNNPDWVSTIKNQ